MNEQIAIQISGLKKQYRLGQIGGGTLKADLQSLWAKIRKKEDPNVKIGQEARLSGQTFMALNGIDLTIRKGEAIGIIGTNGAGKSTMLKILSRITAPTAGTVDICGRIASMLEVGTGFNGEMTGRENVYLNGAILGMTKAEIDAKMEDIIEFSEIRDFIDTPAKRYSSGMYVKLAFSVAAHLDAEIMIMDEILAVGDVAFQKKCLDKMREAATVEGRTVLYVSHNMNTIRRLCDRCIVLDQGKVIFDGDVEKAIDIYAGTGSSLKKETDLTAAIRPSKQTDEKLRFTRVSFPEKDLPVFKTGEPIRLALGFTVGEALENVAIRLVVQTESGTPVGLAATEKGIPVRIGENELPLTLHLDTLAPGMYSVRVAAQTVDEFGHGPMHDFVDSAFMLRIIQSEDDNNGQPWYPHIWGYAQYPTVEVEKDM